MFTGNSNDYFQRVNLQQIISFFMTGAAEQNLEEGTIDERSSRYDKNFFDGMQLFKDRVLNCDWDKVNDEQKDMTIEKMFEEVHIEFGNVKYLYLEIGLVTGFYLSCQIKDTFKL